MKLIDRILDRVDLSPNRRKVVKNVYWAVLGKVVGILNQLLVGIMVARYLGPDQFGLMNYVMSYVMLFSVLSIFGLDNIEVRELSKSGADKDTIVGTAFALRMGFALVSILLIFLTLLRFESDPYTFAMVMVYSVSLIYMAFNVIRNYFTSIILNEYVVKSEISRSVVGALIKVVLLLCHCSLTWFIVASTFDFVLVAGGYLYAYRKKVGLIRAWVFDASVAKMLLYESFPLLLSSAAIIVYQKIDAVMIRNMIDNASVGQFSVAGKIVELGCFVPAMVAQTVTPLLVQAHESDPVRYLKRCQQFMDIMVWSGIGMATVMSVLAAPAIRILFGEKYLAAIPVLQIMAWKTVFAAMATSSGQVIIVEKLQRHAVFRNLVGCLVSVGLNLWLIPVWGIVGSAVATVLTMAFSGYLSHLLIPPYWYLVPMQTRSVLFGWLQGFLWIKKRLMIKLLHLVALTKSWFFRFRGYLPVYWSKGIDNFGDDLNVYLIENISKKKLVWVNPRHFKGKHYFAVGSIVSRVNSRSIVWGSGCMSETELPRKRPLTICAVRGPLTRKVLVGLGCSCPEVYGDPALLLPRLYSPKVSVNYRLGIIPHYVDKDLPWVRNMSFQPGVKILDIQETDPEKFIDSVNECEYILSSSLHGIIISDAYGIPNMWIELSNNVVGEGFKFRDYFLSVKRNIEKPLNPVLITNVEELILQIPDGKASIDLDLIWSACPFMPKS